MPTGPTPWRWQIAPETERRPLFRGAIDSIRLGGETMIITPDHIATPLPRDTAGWPEFALHLRWDNGESEQLTPVIRLDDATGEAIIAVDRRGQLLGMSMRTRAARAGLRIPTVVIPVPTDQQNGGALTATLAIGAGRITAATAGANGSTTATAFFGAQHGWTLINPFTSVHELGSRWQRWTIAWLFGWGLILGWAVMRATVPGRLGWTAAAMSALVLLATASGTAVATSELAGLGAGVLLGLSPVLLLRRSAAGEAATSPPHPGK
jgi:hypothetical protein